jgi:hypothetical protein
MIVEFHSESGALLVVPENRQERLSVESLYWTVLSHAESRELDSSILYLRSDDVLEILYFLSGLVPEK